MLKVLYLINYAGSGGSEKYVKTLAKAFHDKKAKCFFVYNIGGKLVQDMEELGVNIYKLNMKNPFDLAAAFKLSQLCKKLSIDVIHTQYLRENYIAILSKVFNHKVQVVYTNHVMVKNNGLLKFCNAIITSFQKSVIVVCNVAKELLISNKVHQDKIHVIYNGVKYETDNERKESTIREELGIDKSSFVITTVARFSEEKGLDFFIKSLVKLKEICNRKYKCILVGDGPLLDDMEELSRKLNVNDNVIFTGYRSDINNILQGSDLFINSSKNEALSFAILEALSRGLPVVATNVGGNPDIINDETGCGLLVNFGDDTAMANAINSIITDEQLYHKCSSKAYEIIKSKFNIENMLKNTYELYLK